MVGLERIAEVESVVQSITTWAAHRPDVVAVAHVGSWVRGEADEGSDVDLVVLAEDRRPFVEDDGWLAHAVGQPVEVRPMREWGVLTERRAVLASGLEIDIGIAAPTWASIDPVDAGTARVVRDGCRPLYDPDGHIERLIRRVEL